MSKLATNRTLIFMGLLIVVSPSTAIIYYDLSQRCLLILSASSLFEAEVIEKSKHGIKLKTAGSNDSWLSAEVFQESLVEVLEDVPKKPVSQIEKVQQLPLIVEKLEKAEITLPSRGADKA